MQTLTEDIPGWLVSWLVCWLVRWKRFLSSATRRYRVLTNRPSPKVSYLDLNQDKFILFGSSRIQYVFAVTRLTYLPANRGTSARLRIDRRQESAEQLERSVLVQTYFPFTVWKYISRRFMDLKNWLDEDIIVSFVSYIRYLWFGDCKTYLQMCTRLLIAQSKVA